MKSSELPLGSMLLDVSNRALRDRHGHRIELRYQSMSVLVALAARPGEPVSRQEIIETVWSEDHVSEDSLSHCIADIRKALGDADKRVLETVPRVGYRLVVSKPARNSTMRYAISAALVVCAAIVLAVVYTNRRGAPPVSKIPVVAVLPLDDLSTADHAGYLSDALSEGIITELAQFPQFRVVARNSSFQFRGTPTDIRKIGKVLGADYVIEGSQQYDGKSLRVSIQLIETESGTHLLSKKIDRGIGNLFDIQDQIVGHVASLVGGSILTHIPTKRSSREVDSLLRGLQARKLMSHNTRENWMKALALEETSIREDPGSPWGYIGKALMLGNAAFEGWGERPRDEILEEATSLSMKALAIAPRNYMSHYAMARVLTIRREFAESLLHFERAAELNSSDSLVLIGMSLPLLFTGNTERAISILRKATWVDPLHGDWLLWQLGWAYWQNRECEAGLEAMLSMSSPPLSSYTMLAGLYACTGQLKKAKEAMGVFLAKRPGYTIADEIKLNPPDWKPKGTLEQWLADLRLAGMPG